MAEAEAETSLKVPGNNNASYGPIPKADQLFELEFLEIAPSPLPVDRVFFTYLRGEIPPAKKTSIKNLDELLASATISITADLEGGKFEEPRTLSVPLRTTAFGDVAHFSIRDSKGAYVERMNSTGHSDILTDYWIPGMFTETGNWTFEVVARLGDGACLFAVSLTQWLERG